MSQIKVPNEKYKKIINPSDISGIIGITNVDKNHIINNLGDYSLTTKNYDDSLHQEEHLKLLFHVQDFVYTYLKHNTVKLRHSYSFARM